MGTARSRATSAAIAAIGLALAACGGHAAAPSSKRTFGWLTRSVAPAAWPRAILPDGAAVSYPPGWSRIASDRDTASVALRGPRRRFLGYLNITPRQGAESLAGWAAFRVEHNAEEGDRNVRTVSSARGLRFRDGGGSCVQDGYRTRTGARYMELACLVAGTHVSVVVVGASPPDAWPRIAPLLKQSISSTTT